MDSIRFVTVNFHGAECTRRLLDSVALQGGFPSQVSITCTVVDNSTDPAQAKECERVTDSYLFARYLRNEENLGYFGGLNRGLQIDETGRATYVVICNNDLCFRDDFCSILATKSYPQRVFAVCPDVVTMDGFHQNPHVLSRISRSRRLQFDMYYSHYYISRLMVGMLRLFRPRKRERPRRPDGCELHMGVGACYVLTKAFLERFRVLEFPYFLYGEEAFFAKQIHNSGGVLWFDPDLYVTHNERSSLSLVPSRIAYEFARRGYPAYRRLM